MKVFIILAALLAVIYAAPGGYGGGGGGNHEIGGYGGASNVYQDLDGYNYKFGHDVAAPHYGNYHSRQESSSGNSVRGSYYLKEADGSLRRVDYTATHPGGFVATVTDKHGSKTYGNTGYGSGGYGGGAGGEGHGGGIGGY